MHNKSPSDCRHPVTQRLQQVSLAVTQSMPAHRHICPAPQSFDTSFLLLAMLPLLLPLCPLLPCCLPFAKCLLLLATTFCQWQGVSVCHAGVTVIGEVNAWTSNVMNLIWLIGTFTFAVVLAVVTEDIVATVLVGLTPFLTASHIRHHVAM